MICKKFINLTTAKLVAEPAWVSCFVHSSLDFKSLLLVRSRHSWTSSRLAPAAKLFMPQRSLSLRDRSKSLWMSYVEPRPAESSSSSYEVSWSGRPTGSKASLESFAFDRLDIGRTLAKQMCIRSLTYDMKSVLDNKFSMKKEDRIKILFI